MGIDVVAKRELKTKLIFLGRTFKDLSDAIGMEYYRFSKCINGYARFHPQEEYLIRKQLTAFGWSDELAKQMKAIILN